MNYLRLITKYLRNFFKKEPVKVEQPAKKESAKQEAEKIGKRTLILAYDSQK